MVDGRPLAGTVSMLASRFTQMKSPSKTESDPEMSKVIDRVIEETRSFDNGKLVELVRTFLVSFTLLLLLGHAPY